MSTFSLKVIACDRIFFDDECEEITLPLIDGEKGVLANHANMAFAIAVGELNIKKTDGEVITGIVGSGYAQMQDNKVTVVVETAEYPEEIDTRRAKEAKERAEEQLRQKQSQQEYHRSQASLARAMQRLKAGNKDYH